MPEMRDPRPGEECAAEEVELVLRLGLLCSHPLPTARPSMRRVMQYLEGTAPLLETLGCFATKGSMITSCRIRPRWPLPLLFPQVDDEVDDASSASSRLEAARWEMDS